MERILNRHEGKRFWVCGSGGSLLDVIEKKIPKDDIIIACNSSTYHLKNPHYAVFTDETANHSQWFLKLAKSKRTQIILLNPCIPSLKENTIYLEKDFNNWKFSKEDKKIIGGNDVIHCATHVAYMMGASEIILAGVDLKHVSATQKHAHSQKLVDGAPIGLQQTLAESTKANDTLFDGHLGQSLSGWELILGKNHIKVRTIARDTYLKIVDFISFEDACN